MPSCTPAWPALLAAVLAAPASAQSAADLADSLRNQASARGALPWSARHPVAWPDFQGRPHLGTSTAAQTSSGVSYMIQCRDSHLAFAVLAAFAPSESWVRPDIPPSPTASTPTLRHERTHFNISELFARRLAQSLATSHDLCPHRTKEARRIFDQHRSASDATQSRFDRETDHGTIGSQEARWEREVRAGLDSLNTYAIGEGRD